MERREFLKILPLTAIALSEGVLAIELPRGKHYVIVADVTKVDMSRLCDMPLLPKGSTGGWIIPVVGDPETGVKFYIVDEIDENDRRGVVDGTSPQGA